MKVVFALANAGAFVFYDEVARCLASLGHTVEIWHGPINKANLTDRALRAAQFETGTCQSQELLPSRWRRIAWDLRGLIDCGIYFRPEHLSPWLEKRWEQYLSFPVRKILDVPLFRNFIFSLSIQTLLRKLEKRIPLDRKILHQIRLSGPDILLASPYIYGHSYEVDYAKAAHHLGVATVAVVQSWDNLTTKGTYHYVPDVLLVWNRHLLEEAVKIHKIPEKKIVVTGAPRFDTWFATRPSTSREEFLARVGLDAKDMYITYLCSSNSIAGDETAFVCELADVLLKYPPTRHLKLLIRPYPSNTGIWKDIHKENIVIWPRHGDIPDNPEARGHFYDTLYHGIAAFGVNTTAFLEAAIVDKPCVTAFTEHYQRTQVESAHFQHLLRADFIEIAHGFEQAVVLVSQVCSGEDRKADNRRRFVREFIRPHGLDTPAAKVMAEIIKGLAQKRPVSDYSHR